ncbi:MAG: hypothetical protein EPO21_06810 [Chloroflexota bacterium]|nr:MAG: hypothetical protein EPO21_06810 [Chloroflexota bacterium]
MAIVGLITRGSNGTFLVTLSQADAEAGLGVWKPRRGETPLWDFPAGTLYKREYAAYLVSRALGWPNIPPTVIRDGPYGIGALQLFIDAHPDSHYFTFGNAHPLESRQIAVFDVLVNNADRKAGHCLEGSDGRIWVIDHGLTFSAEPKLRTVIWDFHGQPIPQELTQDLAQLDAELDDELGFQLNDLLASDEISTLRERLRQLLATPRFPEPGPYRCVPWPTI